MSNRTYNNVTVQKTAKTDTLESVYNATINTVANSLRSNATYAENTQATTASTDNVSVTNLSISSLTLPSATISTLTQSDITFQNVTISNISTTNLTVTNLNILDNVYLANGSANAPSLSFINDTNTGLYLNNTNELSISCSGTETLRVTDNNIISKENIYLPNGTEAAPALDNTAFNAGVFYNSAQQSIGFSFADNSRALLSQDGLVLDGTDITRILNTDGTEAAPSYTFINDTNTGFYNAGGSLAFSTGGTTRLILNNSSTTFRERVFQNISGSSGFLAIDKNVQPKLSDQTVFNFVGSVRAQATNLNSTWTAVTFSEPLERFVVMSQASKTAYSNDYGITWVSSTLDGVWNGLTYSNERSEFLAVGARGTDMAIAKSSDGITWTASVPQINAANVSGNAWAVKYIPQLSKYFVGNILQSMTNSIIFSTDGTIWERPIGFTGNFTGNYNWRDVAYSPMLNRLVFINSGGSSIVGMYSNDGGLNWTASTNTGAVTSTSQYTIDYSPSLDLFVSMGTNGSGYRVITSRDGITFTTNGVSGVGTSYSWIKMLWINDLQAFVGVASAGTNRVAFSTNGYTWTNVTNTLFNTTLYSLAYSPRGGTLVTVSQAGSLLFTNFNSRLITQQTLNNSNINSVNSDGKETFKFGLSTNMGNIYELQFSNGLPGNGAFPINPSNTYIITNSAFNNLAGGVLANDGNIYIVGKFDKKIVKLDPKTDTVSVNNFNYIGSFNGAVLSPNGKIYCIPSATTNCIGIYDPVSNILDTTTMSGTDLNNNYLSGVLARNGYIYCPPLESNISKTLIINTFSNTYNILSNNLLTANAKGVLGQDGNVYFCSDVSVPTQRGVKLDLSTSFTSPTITQFITGRNFLYNGCLGPNINGSHTIYYVGGGATNLFKLDYPYTGPATNVGVTLPHDFYSCCTLGQDGLIYLIPDKEIGNVTISVLNPLNNTLLNTNISSTFTRNQWLFSILAPNGKIYCFPKQNGFNTVLVITPAAAGISNTANLPPNQSTWVLGPSFNKT